MRRTVLVVGTDHRFQRRAPEFTELQHQRFAAFVSTTATAHGVAAIAEEASIEALAEADRTHSTVEIIAHELQLKHHYCDPNMNTRAKLGILQENQIRISAFFDRLAEAEIQRRYDESMRAREAYWLSELMEFDTWPVLFICGANHSLPFLNLLRTRDLDASLIAQDWGT